MRIKVSDIKRELSVRVEGSEPWLNGIYACFEKSNSNKSTRITAEITISKVVESMFKVTGWIFFDPMMPCSRCGEMARWNIRDENINVLFQQEQAVTRSDEERELLQEELDNYYYSDEYIDLEGFMNERIQLAIPYRNVPEESETEHRCVITPLTDESVEAFSGDMPKQHNPFAALKEHFK